MWSASDSCCRSYGRLPQDASPALLPGHPLAAVVGQGVGHLVRQDGGQVVVVVAGHPQDAGEHEDLAGRQAEGVDLPVPDDVRPPTRTGSRGPAG